MMKPSSHQFRTSPWFRLRHSLWSMIVFLSGSALLIWLVSNRFLIPAMVAAQDATPMQQRQLAATARLLLAIVLFSLCVGILMVFRIRRFFFPRNPIPRQKTEYVDAWTEAGRRLNTLPDSGDSDSES
jgi:hypothetical protein